MMRKVTIALFLLFAARSGYGQTLSSNNIWTGTNTFNNGVYFGQGRPYWDAFAFSASGSNMNTTGTISSGTNVLTLGSAIDFQNKQGIAVYGASVFLDTILLVAFARADVPDWLKCGTGLIAQNGVDTSHLDSSRTTKVPSI